MTYDFWVAAENFLYNRFWTWIYLLGIIFIPLFTIFLYFIEDRKRYRKIFWIPFSIFFILATRTYLYHEKYKVLYDYESHVNYGVRDVKKIIYNWEFPHEEIQENYEELYLVENYRKTTLYDEEIINEEVEFLGRDGNKFYFQDGSYISYRELGENLTVEEHISTPIREGIRFTLIDPQFKNIGFKKESPYTYLLNYKIPKSMENKKFENTEGLKIIEQEESTLDWINPTDNNIL